MSLEWMSPIVNLPLTGNDSAVFPEKVPPTSAGLKKACQNFETYFTASLFSEMTKTLEIGQESGPAGQQAEWMWDLVGQTVAKELSQGKGLGLSQELYRAAAPSLGISDTGLR